jgi:hypothetical protein
MKHLPLSISKADQGYVKKLTVEFGAIYLRRETPAGVRGPSETTQVQSSTEEAPGPPAEINNQVK